MKLTLIPCDPRWKKIRSNSGERINIFVGMFKQITISV